MYLFIILTLGDIMRKILLVMMFIGMFGKVNAGNFTIADDKFKHMYVGAGIYGLCVMGGGVLDAFDVKDHWLTPVKCLIPVAVIGAGKEIYDYNHPESHTAEFADFTYTMSLPVLTTLLVIKF